MRERRNIPIKIFLLESAVKDYGSIDSRVNKQEASWQLGVGDLERGGSANSSLLREGYEGARNTALLQGPVAHSVLVPFACTVTPGVAGAQARMQCVYLTWLSEPCTLSLALCCKHSTRDTELSSSQFVFSLLSQEFYRA